MILSFATKLLKNFNNAKKLYTFVTNVYPKK